MNVGDAIGSFKAWFSGGIEQKRLTREGETWLFSFPVYPLYDHPIVVHVTILNDMLRLSDGGETIGSLFTYGVINIANDEELGDAGSGPRKEYIDKLVSFHGVKRAGDTFYIDATAHDFNKVATRFLLFLQQLYAIQFI